MQWLDLLRSCALPSLLPSNYRFIPTSNHSYAISIASLSLVVEQGDDAGIGDFLFLLNGEEVVDGAAGVAEVVLGKCSPEYIDWVAGFLV